MEKQAGKKINLLSDKWNSIIVVGVERMLKKWWPNDKSLIIEIQRYQDKIINLPSELSGSDKSDKDGTFCIGPGGLIPDKLPEWLLLMLLDLPQSGTSASSCDSCFTRTSMANVIYVIKRDRHGHMVRDGLKMAKKNKLNKKNISNLSDESKQEKRDERMKRYWLDFDQRHRMDSRFRHPLALGLLAHPVACPFIASTIGHSGGWRGISRILWQRRPFFSIGHGRNRWNNKKLGPLQLPRFDSDLSIHVLNYSSWARLIKESPLARASLARHWLSYLFSVRLSWFVPSTGHEFRIIWLSLSLSFFLTPS